MSRPKHQLAKVLIYILAILLAIVPLVMMSSSPASAQATITLSSSVQASFPTAMTFNVKAQSDANITQLRLHYVVDRQSFASVVSEGWAEFAPAASVTTQWVWDMRKSSLPPGSQVQYWWTARDAAGKTAQTARSTVSFEDNRYRWQSITNGPVVLYWYSGSTQFANSLMAAAQEALQRIESDTGAVPQGQAKVYIYASTQDLLGSRLFPQQWEGGVSYGDFGVIAIGVATNQLDFGLRAVPHELVHWVVGQVTFNNYGAGLPTWLNEGLATYGEGTLSSVYQSALNSAIRNNQLISVRSLSSPFSAVPEQAYISYGESNSIVTFLIQKYGKDKMRQLLNVFREGSTYDEALRQVYGFDQDGLDTLWRQSLGIKTGLEPQVAPALALAAAYVQ